MRRGSGLLELAKSTARTRARRDGAVRRRRRWRLALGLGAGGRACAGGEPGMVAETAVGHEAGRVVADRRRAQSSARQIGRQGVRMWVAQ